MLYENGVVAFKTYATPAQVEAAFRGMIDFLAQ
jgi:hypothetical protein